MGAHSRESEIGLAASPYAKAKLARRGRIVADDFVYVRAQAPRGLAKATMASPPVMHFYLGPRSFETDVYADRDAYFAALAEIYRAEIADLASEGCTYLQLDETALPCNCDDHARERATPKPGHRQGAEEIPAFTSTSRRPEESRRWRAVDEASRRWREGRGPRTGSSRRSRRRRLWLRPLLASIPAGA